MLLLLAIRPSRTDERTTTSARHPPLLTRSCQHHAATPCLLLLQLLPRHGTGLSRTALPATAHRAASVAVTCGFGDHLQEAGRGRGARRRLVPSSSQRDVSKRVDGAACCMQMKCGVSVERVHQACVQTEIKAGKTVSVG